MDALEQADHSSPTVAHDPYAALRSPDFRLLVSGTFLAVLSEQMLGVAIGWELYERTNQALALGLIGLVQVVPVVLLALPAGQIADRFDRKRLAIFSLILLSLCSIGLTALSAITGPLLLIYTCLFLIGVARAFQSPALGALTAQVVPPEHYNNAATWESGTWQAASIIGPALGGGLIAMQHSATSIYAINATVMLVLAGLFTLLKPRAAVLSEEPATLRSLLAGLRFVWNSKIILASITLDMFAVLLGGATALMPIFALDVLHVGATGLGILRAAPAIGAVTAALLMAHLPPFKRAGQTLLLVVAGFGVATIVFGLSRSFPLSLLMLALIGGLDNVSVVIRSTLLLLRTPDDMRGRVNAVHYVFIGISNELGAFESGLAAALIGAVGAVAFGGLGTILVVGTIALLWPEVRRLGRLDAPADAPPEEVLARVP